MGAVIRPFAGFVVSVCVAMCFGLLLPLPGCSGVTLPDGGPPSLPIPTSATVLQILNGDFSLDWSASAQRWELKKGGQLLSRLPHDGLRLGIVDTYDEKYNYDPYWLKNDSGKTYTPPGLVWLSPKKVELERENKGTALFVITYDQGVKATLSVAAISSGTYEFELKPQKSDERFVLVRLRFEVDQNENYYGLGEYFDQVAHRGTLRAMQIELDNKLESSYNEAHVPVPFFTGTLGWGLFVESYRPGVFDMAKSSPTSIEITYHTSQLKFYMFAAHHPLDVPGLYTRISGAPSVPAPWAFGTLLWRDENKDQAEVLEDASQIRKHKLAISGMWIDRPYDVGVNNFGFDKARYPDAQKMILELHEKGFRVGLWSTPYLEPGKASQHDLFKTNGWFVKVGLTKLNKWSDPVDLTHPDAMKAWRKLIQNYTHMGIAGFKLDYGEDIQLGVGSTRFKYGFHNGEDERTMHHKYALFYHKAYFDELQPGDHFLICRGGTFGSQKYASIIWPGDLDAGFQKHGECPPGGGKCHVGGLVASIVGGLTLSQSGFPFYGSDTGGYRHDRPTKQVFMRWGQQTALSTIMQIGGPDPNVNPWDFTKYKDSQFDQEVLDNYRKYIRLHTRLFPYNYTYAKAANQHKRGAIRPYGMAFPAENVHPNDQYMFGDFLLVAPVVDDRLSRQVRFPKGHKWISWEGDKVFEGGTESKVDAPLNHLPLFVRFGAVIPMLREDIDTIARSFRLDVVSFEENPGTLHLVVVPGQDVSFDVYDGTSIKFVEGTPFKIDLEAGKVFKSLADIQILNMQKPQKVLANRGEAFEENDPVKFKTCAPCWQYDAKRSILFIKSTITSMKLEIHGATRP